MSCSYIYIYLGDLFYFGLQFSDLLYLLTVEWLCPGQGMPLCLIKICYKFNHTAKNSRTRQHTVTQHKEVEVCCTPQLTLRSWFSVLISNLYWEWEGESALVAAASLLSLTRFTPSPCTWRQGLPPKHAWWTERMCAISINWNDLSTSCLSPEPIPIFGLFQDTLLWKN